MRDDFMHWAPREVSMSTNESKLEADGPLVSSVVWQ
ncbi:MAG: hypothetical protein Harvfovirus9_13 [Harvfovirus sp.]|uniref:Uncharacterized protein n=1 Tax=Harvfovirus sp. TaxID=2487768 RepID=A0A3G5A4Y8_9VIRU|nr:MAG: hypothetical protein Harvfovirus9_13 [Harvfovirus sp.]